ncbi:MAG TPA: serine hydrolase domain-containing protein, partial [Synergistaceae bacterium]|nr:serine hydrolase domain-containing protein [Synergistaceae bacterium]
TFYCPSNKAECADTGFSESRRPLRGQLCQDLEHDMGEILGSDGIFSTARDMLRFSRMILQGGLYEGNRVLSRIAAERMTGDISNVDLCEEPVSYLHYILSGPKVWFWEYALSPFSFFGDLVSYRGIGKMGGAGTFLFLDPEYDLTMIYLTNYGQPENTLEGDAAWNLFQKKINVMGLCNLVLGEVSS